MSIVKYTSTGVVSSTIDFGLFVSDLTPAKCLNLPTIRQMEQLYSKTIIGKSIIAVVKNGVDRFKVNNKMEEDDIIAFAIDFKETFYSECIEDLALCLKYARQGDFGEVYRVDSHTLFTWFREYIIRKAEAREKMLHNRKFEKMEIAKDIVDGFSEIRKNLLKPKEEIKEVYDSHDEWWEQTKEYLHEMSKADLQKLKTQFEMKSSTGIYSKEIQLINQYINK